MNTEQYNTNEKIPELWRNSQKITYFSQQWNPLADTNADKDV